MASLPREQRQSIWQSIHDVTAPKQPPTPIQAKAIADVHELAFRFDVGDASRAEIRAATSGKQRWLATRHTPPDDPAFAPLMAMLDALIADDQRTVVTDRGPFDLDKLIDVGVKITHENGRDVIHLPIRHPWRVKPDEHGEGGERGESIFRRTEDRGPEYGSFGAGMQKRSQERAKEWWEYDDEQSSG